MDREALFRLLFIIIYLIFFIVRIRYRIESTKRTPELRKTESSMATKFLMIAILGYIVSILFHFLALPWMAWSKIIFPIWLRWLGVIGSICSIILVAWTHNVLGKQYSAELAIQIEHTLITTGPYERTRHPMYTSLNMFSFSMALTTSNILVVFFAILVFLPFPWIAREEEEMLIEKFGERYKEYMKRTGRFFPKIFSANSNR